MTKLFRFIARSFTTNRIEPVQPIQPQLSATQRLATLLQELAHSSNHRCLPAQLYRSQEFHALECKHYLTQMPMFVSLTKSFTNPGNFVTLDLGDTSAIIIKGDDECVRGFFNNCSHMNARICQRSHEICHTDRLRCPLHHWTFSKDGQLVAPRTAITRTEQQRQAFALKQLPIVHSHGMMFAQLTATDPNKAITNPLDSKWPNDIDLQHYRVVCKHSETINVDWKLTLSRYEHSDHPHMHNSMVIEPSLTGFIDRYDGHDVMVLEQCLPHAAGSVIFNRYHLIKSSAQTDHITINSTVPLFDACKDHYGRFKQRATHLQQTIMCQSDGQPIAVSPVLADLITVLNAELAKDVEREAKYRMEQERQWAALTTETAQSLNNDQPS